MGFTTYLTIGLGLIFYFDHPIIGGIFLILAFAVSYDAITDIINGKRTFKNVVRGYREYTCKDCGNKFTVNI